MTSTITTRVNKDDKVLFESICKSVGLTPSSAIALFIKTTIRKGEIPFKIKTDPFFNEANQDLLRESIKQLEGTNGTVHKLDLN